jgi:hypothetical protein
LNTLIRFYEKNSKIAIRAIDDDSIAPIYLIKIKKNTIDHQYLTLLVLTQGLTVLAQLLCH